MSTVFTELNLEQSIARYFANKLLAEGYSVYWHETKRLEGVGPAVTILREFPRDPTYLILPDQPLDSQKIRLPAFTITAANPKTDVSRRLGVGESIFEWTAEIRLYGLVDSEQRWYEFSKHFKHWFGHPDIRVDLLNQEADLTNPNPPIATEKIQFTNVDVYRDKLSIELPTTIHYYVQLAALATFVE